jgi:hypothetical protein
VVVQLISGGQTGVDRAALDAALEQRFPCGGWCPRGRRAEDGPLSDRYPLRETKTTAYPARTAANVRAGDGTLIILRGQSDRGTALTGRLAAQLGKPLLVVDLQETPGAAAVELILRWSREHGIETLNVAGPRESGCPGIYREALEVMRALIAALQTPSDLGS